LSEIWPHQNGPIRPNALPSQYLSPEQRVRPSAARDSGDERPVFAELAPRFTKMYSDIGRPSIPPEQLLRALLLQSLYTVRRERLLDGRDRLQRAVSVVVRLSNRRSGNPTVNFHSE
jgi:hypothetical protein